MKLSKRGEYSLRALLALTFAYKSNPIVSIQLRVISEGEKIPYKFLEQIMSALKNGSLVKSQKGKHGGYVLAKPPEQINLGEVIRLMDGPLAPAGNAEEIRGVIERGERNAGIYSILLEVRNAIAGILDSTTLEDVYQRTQELWRDRKSQHAMYYI